MTLDRMQNIRAIRRKVIRAAGAPYLAEIGDDLGRVYTAADPGYMWVRKILSDDGNGALVRGQPFLVRAMTTHLVFIGAQVWIAYNPVTGYDEVVGNDFDSLVEQGYNPAIVNPLNPYTQFVDTASLLPLKTYAVADGATATTEVAIKNLVYLDYLGGMVAYKMSAASRPDIGDYAPTTANTKRLVHLWLNHDKTIGVSQSTPIAEDMPFSITTDLAEVLENPPDNLAKPIGAWQIKYGQTTITPEDLFYDTRQWLPGALAAGIPNPVIRNYVVPSGMSVSVQAPLIIPTGVTLEIKGTLTIQEYNLGALISNMQANDLWHEASTYIYPKSSKGIYLAAGTAAAGTAPIRLTPGTLLAAPESGTLEYDGTGFYFTSSNHQRFVVLSSDSLIATVTATNNVAPTTLWTGILNANELKAHRVYKVDGFGLFTTHDANDYCTLTCTINGTTVNTITTPVALVTDKPWHFSITFTIRTVGAAGTLSSGGHIEANTKVVDSVTESIAVDTTVVNNIVLTAQWSDASNSLKLTQCSLTVAD